jgi:hypothetical protein
MTMKWSGYTRRGADEIGKVFAKRTFYYLMLVASLGVLLGASVKWHG